MMVGAATSARRILHAQRLPITAPEDAARAAMIRWPPVSPPGLPHAFRATSCDPIAAQPGWFPERARLFVIVLGAFIGWRHA